MPRFVSAIYALCAEAAIASPLPAQSATLFGTLLRDSLGHPLAGATVELPSLHRATRSDSLGNFKFDRLPGGKLTLTARHVGFNRLDDEIDLPDGGTYAARYVLEEWPVILEPVDVKAETKKWISSELNEFEERRTQNVGGYFITDSVLSTTETHSVQSLLLGRIPHLSKAGSYVKSGRVVRGNCLPVLFVDGIVQYQFGSAGASIPDLAAENPNLYSGVEYYPDGATAPPRFNITGTACGVLLLWSRERITKP
jgi:hypothetical protein